MDPVLRAELVDAIAKVRRQIELDQRSLHYPSAARSNQIIGQLRNTLYDLEEALAKLDAEDAARG
ncbi:MAG TPA: hypothetical protein VHW60_14005 [Caulobacteraceae bacterium]|jgi:hypothetical protein|nr:hypothetical protein [Caulobacteraceae bacterium]